MTAIRLPGRRVEKVWGRRDLGPWFDPVPPDREPVGEIWYEMPGGLPEPELLVKVLFTSERLSVQVHPGDALAQAAGLPRGKDEAWYVLDAEPQATLGLGMKQVISREALRRSALDGSILGLMHWQAVRAGDCYYAPSGTVHAIGAGLTIVEIQQNSDVTYRLYDYGRPRELHLEAGVEAADPVPWVAANLPEWRGHNRLILANTRNFVLERWSEMGAGTLKVVRGRPCWLFVLAGFARVDGRVAAAGQTWFAQEPAALSFDPTCELLLAYPGGGIIGDLWSGEADVADSVASGVWHR